MANYSHILKADIANGPGFRVSLWISGCMRKCPGCFNKEAQDHRFGMRFDDTAKLKIFDELAKPTCDGLSLLGGEPMSKLSDNRQLIILLAKECKEKFPSKTIWMWSGYTFEELNSDKTSCEIFKYIDVLIDGPFESMKKDLTLAYRGSSNQRVIDILKTLKENLIVSFI